MHKNCIKLDFYLPHHLQIYHATARTLLKACIIHCLTYKDWASYAFTSDMCTPLAKILDPPLVVLLVEFCLQTDPCDTEVNKKLYQSQQNIFKANR